MTDTVATEREELMKRADDMGISYSANIKTETLRNRVNDKLSGTTEDAEPVLSDAQVSPASTTLSKHQALRKEALKLIRCRVIAINPAKKESKGEWVRTGNKVIKTFARFVPFETETHVEQMALNHLRQRKYAVPVHEKDREGRIHVIKRQRPEFQIEILPALTTEELKDLAAEQARRGTAS